MAQVAQTPSTSTHEHGPGTIRARGLSKTYGSGSAAVDVLHELDLVVHPGEFVSIVGPSGTGKTTLLRCLAGLLQPSAGTVSFGGNTMSGPVEEIGVVFQDYSSSLLPWMSTIDNVAFPLLARGVGKRQRRKRAADELAAVGLQGVGERYPWQLSGGMQQRAAIARALAYDAKVLLMDEPFASVDAQTRIELEDLVLELRRRLGLSVLVVTHDIDEAVYLSDRVIVLSGHPATVIDTVTVDLGDERDQLSTKADPRFAELRGRILAEIRRPVGNH